ncbi:ectoine synthase [Marinicrinis lubricantis]|uniref:L-ectoine synthase n=1 Tax=Marinicrinis lubricantis TaxID=2086470 RepID=A0ABW1IM87_9BACL
MIVRSLENVLGTERDVQAETWSSRRLLLKNDGMGFSLHDTVLHEGTVTRMWYKNHVEAVYCIEGEAVLEDLTNNKTYTIKAGDMYALSGNEQHILTVKQRFRCVCVFNPPCTGREVHDEEGAYPILD